MRVLLDTHTYFWWETDDPKLSRPAHDAVADATTVFVSAVTAWELTSKVRFGKWPQAATLAADMPAAVEAEKFTPLPVTLAHAHFAGLLPGAHRDPFDRMLAAQAQIEDVALVTADPVFHTLGVRILW